MSTRSKVIAGIIAFQSIAMYCLIWFGNYAIVCGHDWVNVPMNQTIGFLSVSMIVLVIGGSISLMADDENNKKGR